MRLQALSAGTGASSGAANGRIHAAFANACVIRLSTGGIVTLLARHLGNVPHGIRVATPAHFEFTRHGRPQDVAVIRDTVLRIGNGALIVDLAPAASWAGDVRNCPVDPGDQGSQRAWSTGWALLSRSAAKDRDALLSYRPILMDGLTGLIISTADFDVTAATGAATGIIGLGPGLTPAGDDVLVGLLAGLWATAGTDPDRIRFAQDLGDAALSRAHATTLVSRAYLQAAARGGVSEPMLRLVQAVARGKPPAAVRGAVEAAFRVGATSGADGVLGLLAGLAAWHAPARRRVLDSLARSQRHAA